jgi:hypothetical protein
MEELRHPDTQRRHLLHMRLQLRRRLLVFASRAAVSEVYYTAMV